MRHPVMGWIVIGYIATMVISVTLRLVLGKDAAFYPVAVSYIGTLSVLGWGVWQMLKSLRQQKRG